MRAFFLCVCLVCASWPALSMYTIGIERIDLPPYYKARDGHFRGYARAALDAFAHTYGFTFEYKMLPVRRVESYVRQGLVDAMFPDNPHWGHEARLHYSRPLFSSVGGLALRKREKITTKKAWRLGVVEGFTLPPELAQAVKTHKARLVERKGIGKLLRMLYERRVDAVYTSRTNFLHTLAGKEQALRALMFQSFHKKPTGFSLSSLKEKSLIDAFDDFLKKDQSTLTHIRQEAFKIHK